jgi:hypothetical protein
LGLVRNKGGTLGFPSYLRKDLYPAFLRGVFEGDGSFCLSKRKNRNSTDFVSTLCCAPSFYEGMKEAISFLGIDFRPDGTVYDNGVIVIRFGGPGNGLKFFNYIYAKHNGFYMERKYKKFIELFEYKKSVWRQRRKDIVLVEESEAILAENKK